MGLPDGLHGPDFDSWPTNYLLARAPVSTSWVILLNSGSLYPKPKWKWLFILTCVNYCNFFFTCLSKTSLDHWQNNPKNLVQNNANVLTKSFKRSPVTPVWIYLHQLWINFQNPVKIPVISMIPHTGIKMLPQPVEISGSLHVGCSLLQAVTLFKMEVLQLNHLQSRSWVGGSKWRLLLVLLFTQWANSDFLQEPVCTGAPLMWIKLKNWHNSFDCSFICQY